MAEFIIKIKDNESTGSERFKKERAKWGHDVYNINKNAKELKEPIVVKIKDKDVNSLMSRKDNKN